MIRRWFKSWLETADRVSLIMDDVNDRKPKNRLGSTAAYIAAESRCHARMTRASWACEILLGIADVRFDMQEKVS